MATAPPAIEKEELLEDPGSGGGAADIPAWGGDGPRGREAPDRRYYTGMLMGLGAITMLFAAFTSAMIVRKGLSDDWQTLSLPFLLWPNTALLLLSSFTLEAARRRMEDLQSFSRWWGVTLGLGAAFLAGQLVAWRQLAAQGVYVHSNPGSSFFYVLTAAHGVHLLGGVLALFYVFRAVGRERRRPHHPHLVGVTALYWHFMDGLWIYLLLLLLMWR